MVLRCSRVVRSILMGLAVLALTAVPARADKRDYLEAYPYWTPRQGEIEFEFYNDWENGLPRQQIEVELGVTDRFMAGIYGVWENRGEGQGTRYDGTKLELRYRLAPYRKFIVDPTLYFEYKKSAIASEPDAIEGKLILSKDIGNLNIVANVMWEKELRAGQKPVFEYIVATCYPVSKTVTAGLEYVVNDQEKERRLIPGIYWQLSRRTRLNLGVGIDLTPVKTPINLRSIFSWEL